MPVSVDDPPPLVRFPGRLRRLIQSQQLHRTLPACGGGSCPLVPSGRLSM
jgi:hypothetical protein